MAFHWITCVPSSPPQTKVAFLLPAAAWGVRNLR
jgi:hypothetical protein